MKIIILIAILVTGVGLSVIADIFLKKSGWTNWYWIAAGSLAYAVVAVIVAAAFHYAEFGKVFLIWEVMALILGMLIAGWHYKEPFTVYRFISLLLAVFALYFSYK